MILFLSVETKQAAGNYFKATPLPTPLSCFTDQWGPNWIPLKWYFLKDMNNNNLL